MTSQLRPTDWNLSVSGEDLGKECFRQREHCVKYLRATRRGVFFLFFQNHISENKIYLILEGINQSQFNLLSMHIYVHFIIKLVLAPLGESNGTPLQYSCLENPMDGGAWWAAVHGIAKSWTQLCDFTFTFYFHALEKEMATHSSVLAWRIPETGEPGGLPSVELQSQTRLKRLSSSSSSTLAW